MYGYITTKRGAKIYKISELYNGEVNKFHEVYVEDMINDYRHKKGLTTLFSNSIIKCV